jgi:hypothetical protein
MPQIKGTESENIYSLSIEEDGRASWNISIQFPCVCVCLSLSW